MQARTMIGIALLWGLALSLAATATAQDGRPEPQLNQGMLLVAKRDLVDPNFRHTVVILVRHEEEGTLGLIVNRVSEMSLSKAIPELEGAVDTRHKLAFGGPVETSRVLFLVRQPGSPEQSINVFDDIYLSASRSVLEKALSDNKSPNELQVYAGHAGWAPGQLEYELKRGDWLVAQGDPEVIFGPNAATLWEVLIEQYDPPGLFVLNQHNGHLQRSDT